ncbi:MAG TPA: tetratricopeptide repeat protein [Micropepsaceae bacterium]|nr:tetratricopeptide repeat protein [Micropepsaceae bacterium]
MNSTRSGFARLATIVILAAFAAALPQIVVAQSDPLAGTFNFVPARSTATPGPLRYKSMTLNFSDPTQMTVEGVDAQGKPVKGTFMAVPDGKPHPITGFADFDSGSWSRFNDTTTTYSYTKRKTNIVLGTRALSPDGNVLTFNEKTYDDKGKQISTTVMVFAKPGFEVASATPSRPAVAAPTVMLPATTPDEDAGTAAIGKGDSDGAIAAFTRAIDSKDKVATPVYDHIMRGLAYANKGMTEQALADFDAAVKLKPDDPDARFRRGGLRVVLKQYQEAIEDLTVVVQAGQTDAKTAAAYSLRGAAYDAVGQYNNGNADEDKACELNKDFCKK